MGMEGSVSLLATAGQPKEVVAAAHHPKATNFFCELPAEFAARLFVLKSGSTNLTATNVKLSSDGVDDVYALTYAWPAPGLLEIEASYFKHIESLMQGVFVVQNTNGEQLAAALLSREHISLRIPLDATDTNLAAAVSAMQMIVATSPAPVPALPAKTRPSFSEFFKLGVWHILTGFDHLLFLCALLICVRRVGPMLGVITCFTLAHSVTLALAAMELVNISSRIIEPLIAASIIVVGIENLVRREAQGDRYWMAGSFGLIHGFGFASALRETGLGRTGSEIVMPLFSFNIGVEAGQVAVATAVIPLLFLGRRWFGFGRWVLPAVSAVVILVSAYWFLQRIFFAQ
jgi:hydrogenase/urease accessory protein HupE